MFAVIATIISTRKTAPRSIGSSRPVRAIIRNAQGLSVTGGYGGRRGRVIRRLQGQGQPTTRCGLQPTSYGRTWRNSEAEVIKDRSRRTIENPTDDAIAGSSRHVSNCERATTRDKAAYHSKDADDMLTSDCRCSRERHLRLPRTTRALREIARPLVDAGDRVRSPPLGPNRLRHVGPSEL
jgi:hypothetical protein